MFFSFSTTPAERAWPRGRPRPTALSRTQAAVTWGLLTVWVLLMSFGVVAMTDPGWLREIARRGVDAEALEYTGFGDAALGRRNFEAAIGMYRRSLEIKPDQPGVMVNLAAACINAGIAARTRGGEGREVEFMRHAAGVLSDALRLETTPGLKAQIHLTIGDLLQQQGKLDDAIWHYETAVDSCVEVHKVRRKLGALHLARGDLDKARDSFERTLEEQLDPGLQYRIMLRRYLEEEGDDDEDAREALKRQSSEGPTPEELSAYDLGIIRRSQRYDLEIAKTHHYLGVTHARLGNTAVAKEHLQAALRIWPQNAALTRDLKALDGERRPGPP